MTANKDPRADAKLQNLPDAALEELWRLRHPEEGGTKSTLESIAAHMPAMHGCSISLAALSGFYRWLDLKRRMDQRNDLIDQLLRDAAAAPDATPEKIERRAQVLFMTEAVARQDLKGFASIAAIGQNRVKLDQNKETLKLNKERVGHDERKLKLLEDKAAQADKASAVTHDGKLTDAEKAAELKRIFRMG